MQNNTMINFVAFLSTIAFILLFKKYAPRVGLVDIPGGRKEHDGAVPVIGGVAIFFAFLFTALILGFSQENIHCFFVSLLLLVTIGVLDDLRDLTARARFLVQIMAALLMASWGGIYFGDLGNLLGSGVLYLNNWAIPFTVFAVIGVVNAFNMIDGVDGLAGGLSFIALMLLGVVAWFFGVGMQPTLIFLLASAVLGFLFFNMRTPWLPKAAVFMGDAGSMMLGFSLMWFAIDMSSGNDRIITPITAVWVLAIPIMDTVNTMARRVIKGRSPFSADREHLHHIFLRAGYSVHRTVVIILAVALLLGMVGLAGWYYRVPEYLMCYGFLIMFGFYSLAMHHAWKLMKRIKVNDKKH